MASDEPTPSPPSTLRLQKEGPDGVEGKMSRSDVLTEQDRRDYYVYVHVDENDNFFYIGKGTGRRAWSKDRDRIWHRYVNERLGGKWRAEIVKEGLSGEEALAIEKWMIEEYGEQLVNWDNPRRQFDEEALAKYHDMREAARKLVEAAKALEATDLKQASAMYWEALDAAREYEKLVLERGLVAELNDSPKYGFPKALDRLTDCLVRLGRVDEAIAETKSYFEQFPHSLQWAPARKAVKRLEKYGLRLPGGKATDTSDDSEA